MDMGFSTLYRVDAIEAYRGPSMFKFTSGFSTLYRVDAIEARGPACGPGRGRGFSTLYRVDAIEARRRSMTCPRRARFQYPLSGRCY